jgi:hypothetical protein
MSAPDAAPYEKLAQLIEHELDLAREARYEDLADAAAARVSFTRTLPETPPAAAREPLQRALRLHRELERETARGRDALLTGARELDRATRAARGYAPPRRREHLSASA